MGSTSGNLEMRARTRTNSIASIKAQKKSIVKQDLALLLDVKETLKNDESVGPLKLDHNYLISRMMKTSKLSYKKGKRPKGKVNLSLNQSNVGTSLD
jgi:hypothetical protein